MSDDYFKSFSSTATLGFVQAKCSGEQLKSDDAFLVIDCVAYFSVRMLSFSTSRCSLL